MTKETYLAEFERHLRVGDTKRGDIIAELNTHLEELSSNEHPETVLGDPKPLATRYNRTHIGFFSSDARIAATPFAIAALNLAFMIILRTLPDRWNAASNAPPLPDASAYAFIVMVLVPIAAALLIGRALARTDRPWQRIKAAMLWAFSAIAFMEIVGPFVVNAIANAPHPTTYDSSAFPTNFYTAVVGPLAIAILYSLFLGAIAVFTVIAIQAPLLRTHNTAAKFEGLLYGFIALIVFVVSLGLSEFLAPYDLVPPEARPPYPDPVRIWNDLFETPIATIVVTSAVFWKLARRLRKGSPRRTPIGPR